MHQSKKQIPDPINRALHSTESRGTFQFVDERKSNQKQQTFQQLANHTAQGSKTAQLQEKANKTGLPDQLKSGIEGLSGVAMDDVKVHYNSAKPAQLQAHAYAQGNQIHIASGQEKHLPHEAWHVVQQKQGRVKPTAQLKGKVNINDNVGLEKEANVMGAKAFNVASHSGIQLMYDKNTTQSNTAQRVVTSELTSPNAVLGFKICHNALIQILAAHNLYDNPHLRVNFTETALGVGMIANTQYAVKGTAATVDLGSNIAAAFELAGEPRQVVINIQIDPAKIIDPIHAAQKIAHEITAHTLPLTNYLTAILQKNAVLIQNWNIMATTGDLAEDAHHLLIARKENRAYTLLHTMMHRDLKTAGFDAAAELILHYQKQEEAAYARLDPRRSGAVSSSASSESSGKEEKKGKP